VESVQTRAYNVIIAMEFSLGDPRWSM